MHQSGDLKAFLKYVHKLYFKRPDVKKPDNLGGIEVSSDGKLRAMTHMPPKSFYATYKSVSTSSPDTTRIIDTRPSSQFASGHISGSINMPLNGSEHTKEVDEKLLASLPHMLPQDVGLFLITAPGQDDFLYAKLTELGFGKSVVAVLKEGWDAYEAAHLPSETVARMEPSGVAKAVSDGYVILDVRTTEQFEDSQGHLNGAQNVPITQLVSGNMAKTLASSGKNVIVYDQSGVLSMAATSYLLREKVPVLDISGGLNRLAKETPTLLSSDQSNVLLPPPTSTSTLPPAAPVGLLTTATSNPWDVNPHVNMNNSATSGKLQKQGTAKLTIDIG